MLNEISDAILYKLKKEGLSTNELDFNSLVNKRLAGFQRPSVSIAIPTISYKMMTLNKTKCSPIFSLFVLVHNLSSEKKRTVIMNDLIEAIHKILLHENLGLNLEDKFKPVSANDVTSEDFANKGCLIYEIKLSCSFSFQKIPEDDRDLGIIEAINNKHYSHDPNDDGILDVESSLGLYEADGGNAFSIYYDDMDYDGGIAGTEDYYENDLNGGTSGSKYSE